MTKPSYDKAHRQLRQQWAQTIAHEGGYTCPRCHQWFTNGQQFDLGHPTGRGGPTMPECLACNRAEGANRGNNQRRNPTSRDWT